MQAPLVGTGAKAVKTIEQMEPQERAFQQRIDAGIKLEPKDWMPEAYRRTLIRQIATRAFLICRCRAHVVEGEVEMDINFALEDYEVARGCVLCCQSCPISDTLVIDLDQEHAHS